MPAVPARDFQENCEQEEEEEEEEKDNEEGDEKKEGRKTTMTMMTGNDASRRVNGVAALLLPKDALELDAVAIRVSWSRTTTRTPRLVAWAARCWPAPWRRPACPSWVASRTASGRYIWRRGAVEPQPLLSRPPIHNPPPRLVSSSRESLFVCAHNSRVRVEILVAEIRSVGDNRIEIEREDKWRLEDFSV